MGIRKVVWKRFRNTVMAVAVFFFLIFKAFKVIAAKYTANTAYGREGCDKKRH